MTSQKKLTFFFYTKTGNYCDMNGRSAKLTILMHQMQFSHNLIVIIKKKHNM